MGEINCLETDSRSHLASDVYIDLGLTKSVGASFIGLYALVIHLGTSILKDHSHSLMDLFYL